MMMYLLDPGHGGKDPGAVAEHGGAIYEEASINLAVTVRLGDLLRKNNRLVFLTRSSNYSLSPRERMKILEAINPDGFISIHCNSFSNPRVNGTETIYRDDYDLHLARCVHDGLCEKLKTLDRGVRSDVDYLRRKLTVLDHLTVAACLVELGFITNQDEVKTLSDFGKVAEGLCDGIIKWEKQRGVIS